ncbi:hypothetical protein [Paraflavitalea pollutisoli]|uniref:hypothetical protein n=1 Tax=Paraflavitalea pollutisoli TaxID=3034143 RepID=UPI0023EA8EE8|nr:hypothetical protein [Paraflavitalea sp. H1-2-19X]
MSKTTKALIDGLNEILKNRGSMTVKECELLRDVIAHLREHDEKKGDERFQNGMRIAELLMRWLTHPLIAEQAQNLIDKLL